jgi:hypothetical protein
MANLVISGDSSGSITLAAPAVSGTTILTLPTTTGTLVVTGGAQTIEFADGTVSAPSITNSGDTNTGIFFPAADTIAFTEGGVESMRIDSAGNVGIGTATPQGKFVASNSGANGFEVQPDSSSGTETRINSFNRSSVAFTPIGINASQHYWLTSSTERMRINSTGDVGIGTASPSSRLTMSGATGNTNGIHMRAAGWDSVARAGLNGTVGGDFILSANWNAQANTVDSGNASAAINLSANEGMIGFNVGAAGVVPTERMRITQTGNVGIGTSSPFGASGRNLTIYNSSGQSRLALKNSVTGDGANDGFQVGIDGDGMALVEQRENLALMFATNATERMRIDSSGRLLVNTSDSGANVQMRLNFVGSAVNGFRLEDTAASGSPYMFLLTTTAKAANNTQTTAAFTDTSATRWEFRANGGLSNYQANNVNLSDEREKTNIKLAANYLDKICAIPVKTFNYIDQNLEEDDGLTLGVIAQDVEAVAPELVMESDWSKEKNGSKMRLSIYQTDLQYALMKAIQELNAKVTALEKQLGAK